MSDDERIASGPGGRRRPSSRRRCFDQRGEMLLETIATIVILSTVVLGLLLLLGTVVKVSMTHEAIVRTSNEATIAAEYIERLPYRPCSVAGGVSTPSASTYQNDMGASAAPYVSPDGLTLDLSVQEVEYLESGTATTANFVTDCPNSGDQGAQKLTVRVVGQDSVGSVASDVVFLKRDDLCVGLSGAQEGQTC